MERKVQPVSKTRISKILNECKFDPKKDKAMSVIADVGNPDYLTTRAIEVLSGKKPNRQMAIGLLALAEAKS